MAFSLAPPRRSVVVFDEEAAARHSSEFTRLLEDPELRSRIVVDVVGRRAQFAVNPGLSGSSVAVEELEGLDGSRALIARGEVLVSTASVEAVRLLTSKGFARLGRVGSVLRFQNLDADATMVRATCHELLWRGAEVSPNYVVYAGGTVKARLGLLEPLPTNDRPVAAPTNDRLQSTVRVAVLDTAGANVEGGTGHGTFVAGLVRQLAPDCRLDMQPVLSSDGLGTDFSTAQALRRLAADVNPPPIVNMSLYCTPVDGLRPVGMAAALDTLATRHPETVVVAAAGNDGSWRPSWPAAHPFVVAVGAVDGKCPAAFSNRGPWVDFSARADGVVSNSTPPVGRSGTGNLPPFAAWSGTSFAAAQISGVLAALAGKGLSRAEATSELTQSGIFNDACGVAVEPGSLT